MNELSLVCYILDQNGEPFRAQWEGLFHQEFVQFTQISTGGISYSNFKIKTGGNGNSLLFFESPSLTFYLPINKETASVLIKIPALKEHSDAVRVSSNKKKAGLILSLVLLVAVPAGLIFKRAPLANVAAGAVPLAFEKSIADQVIKFRKLNAEQKDLQIKFSYWAKPLLDQNNKDGAEITLHLSSDLTPNAYATLGGHVFAHKGLFDVLNSPSEIVGVLAHEMVHVKKRHVFRGIVQGVGVFVIFQALLGDFTGIIAVLADQGAPLLMLQHTRELEIEADTEAVKMLVNAGINPAALKNALKSLSVFVEKERAQNPVGELEKKIDKLGLFSSHPDMEARIKNLDAQIAKIKSKPTWDFSQIDYDEFKDELRKRF